MTDAQRIKELETALARAIDLIGPACDKQHGCDYGCTEHEEHCRGIHCKRVISLQTVLFRVKMDPAKQKEPSS